MYALLIGYWFLFWQKFLRNPFLLCTSEIASTYFPFWIAMGRKWSFTDSIYYKYPGCIPFLSMFYPPSVLVSKFSKYLSLDNAFKLYVYFILGHYLLGSFLAYKAFGLLGAITLMYAGYCIKPQTPAFVYTICWMPGFFIESPLQPLFLGMAMLGGYWPIMAYTVPLCLILDPLNTVFGLSTAFPQILPFIWYWKRSIRAGQKVDVNFGKLPWWKLKDLFLPSKSVSLVNGVHYPEAEMYMGIAILFIWKVSWLWLPLSISLLVCIGFLPSIQRIPARALYLTIFLIVCLIHDQTNSLFLILIQAFLLLRNASIYPSFPFSQWWDKPSRLYSKHPYNGVWPNVTGYLRNQKISDYRGAFALKNYGT